MSELKVRDFNKRAAKSREVDPFSEITYGMKRRLEGEWRPQRGEWWRRREVFMVFGTILALALVAMAFEIMD